GTPYAYGTGGGAQLDPRSGAAAAAFDPSRFFPAGSDAAARGGSGSGPGGGSGGLAGTYDGATVPVFGQLAGLNGGTALDEGSVEQAAASTSTASTTLPAAALAAVVALAAVSAALVRTHQASRAHR
ncbi:hypothetical protein, partial [Candidatus Blastococcus massiliensis]|uniref:hypothetical protein n=1 Tax=Candidatus Blastococcus massiliensis TaxID=1470358 RepID=UPI0018CC0FD6